MKLHFFSLILLILPSTGFSADKQNLTHSLAGQKQLIAPMLQTLAEPVAPPASLRLPETLVESGQWRGVQCGIVQAGEVVFRDAQTWEDFWTRAMAPHSKRLKNIPVVDFSKEIVVGVFGGERPYPIAEVEITDIKGGNSDSPQGLTVHFRAIEHFKGISTPKFAVHPYHLKKVPVLPASVEFRRS